MTQPGGAPWWANAIFYQVYPRSFADSNGDGVGDLDGVTAHLDHLSRLGVDAIWLNPVMVSPMADHGYDVADPRDVDPLFGGLAALERLIAEAHARGIRITMDLVPNHTSSAHAWFQAALAAGPGSAERERYIFRDGLGRRRAAPAQQLGIGVRRAGLDSGHRSGRHPRPVVPAPVRRRTARPQLGQPRGVRRPGEDAAVLARPRCGRLPHRRRARHGQATRPAGHGQPRHRDAHPRRRRSAVQPRRVCTRSTAASARCSTTTRMR